MIVSKIVDFYKILTSPLASSHHLQVVQFRPFFKLKNVPIEQYTVKTLDFVMCLITWISRGLYIREIKPQRNGRHYNISESQN